MANAGQDDLKREIDALKSRVAELEQTEMAQYYLAAVVESAEDAIITKSLDGVVTSWNRGAESTFGYSASEMIGKPISILLPAGRQGEETEILGRLRKGERVETFDSERVRKGGQTIHVSLTV